MSKLIYNKVAKKWIEALPVGNGLTGVMAYGSLCEERLAINNSSLWSGYPKDQNNSESLNYLDEVRKLLDKGKYHKADKLAMDKLKGGYSESFLPLGDIFIKFNCDNNEDYRRELDLDTAVLKASSKDVNSELFANYPSNIVCYKIQSNKKISVKISASSKLKYSTFCDGDSFSLIGNAPDFVMPNYVLSKEPIDYKRGFGMGFCLTLKIESDGDVTYSNREVEVCNFTNCIMYFTTKTGYNGFDKMPNVDAKSLVNTAKSVLKAQNYAKLKEEHIQDYRSIYTKQTVSFGSEYKGLTTTLLESVKEDNIPKELVELFYNYGKYLMIAGSRKGGEALNLQGIWNEDIRPAWSSNYTVNINTEMNYWPVSRCDLLECYEPFFRLVKELCVTGRKTAKTNYGVGGACCNHNTDLWRKTSPVIGCTNFMFEPLCGAWLVNEMYFHYKNAQLEEYKQEVFEIVKQFAIFINEYLVKKDGKYIITPSTSPEAMYRDKLFVCGISVATAFDMSVARQLLQNYLEMDSNSDFARKIKEKLDNLYPIKEGKLGVSEFYNDKQITDKGHRHFSPLYALYPANLIKKNTKEYELCKKLFACRVSHSKNHIGWSAGWGICLASRLHDRESTNTIMYSLFTKSVFSNLFDAHFPNIFQIDGNFGFVAGVNEMLLYEQDKTVELIPNLIDSISCGSVTGMVVNGAKISFSWMDNLVTNVSSTKPIKVINKRLSKDIKIDKNIQIVEEF